MSEMFPVADEQALDDLLSDMNENGIAPVVVGMDDHHRPFLAYGWAPGGDGWDTGLVFDNPWDTEGDVWDADTKTSHPRCEECGVYEMFDIARLPYPVQVINQEVEISYPPRKVRLSELTGSASDLSREP